MIMIILIVAVVLIVPLTVYFFWLRRHTQINAGGMEHRLEESRAAIMSAVEGHQARLGRFPSGLADRPDTFTLLSVRLVRGFLWGLLLGLVLEAVGLIILPLITSAVRETGL